MKFYHMNFRSNELYFLKKSRRSSHCGSREINFSGSSGFVISYNSDWVVGSLGSVLGGCSVGLCLFFYFYVLPAYDDNTAPWALLFIRWFHPG